VLPEYCTCGAELVADARFCHKCGRPVREEDRSAEDAAARQVRETPPPPVPAEGPVPPPALPEIGFQNKIAVRIGALLAGPIYLLINFLALLPGGFLFVFLGLFASGFLAVLLYKQRTGSGVSVISGARLGWICGVFVFVIALVLLTFVAAVAARGDLAQIMQEQLKRQGQTAAEVQRVVEFLSNPAALLMLLVTFFVTITTVPSLGGAFGAKVLDSRSRS
jgi:hypothetical protein